MALKMNRRTKFSLIVFFLLTLMQLPHFFLPIQGGHRWRQADTWAIAKNFAIEDPNFLFPRVDVRGDKTGIDAAETPFYPYLVSLFFRLFKTIHPFWGKFISFFFGLGLVYVLGRWISEELKVEPFHGFFVVGVVQIIFSYSICFMPEVFSLFFSILGSYLLFLDYHKKNFFYLILGFVFITIGITSRPMQIFWGLSYLYLIYLAYREKKIIAWRYLSFGFFSLALFLFWYVFWSSHLRQTYGMKYFARFVDEFSIKNFYLFFDYEFYFNVFKHLVGASSIPIFSLATVGFYFWFKNKSYRNNLSWLFLGVFLLTLLGIPLVSQRHFINHNYYLISLQALMSYFATLSFTIFWQKREKYALIFAALSFLAIFANNFHTYRTPKEYFLLKEVKEKIDENPPKLLAMESVDYAYGLYVLNKRGFVLYHEEIRQKTKVYELIQKGVDYFIVREGEKFSIYHAKEWLSKLQEEKS